MLQTRECYKTPEMSSLHHALSLVACMGHLSVFAVVVLRRVRNPIGLILAVLCVDLFAWNAADLAEAFSGMPEWGWIDAAASSLTMPLAFHFVLTFVGRARESRNSVIVSYVAFGLLALFNLSAFFSQDAARFAAGDAWAGALLAGAAIEAPICGYLLHRHAKSTTDEAELERTRLIFIALVLGAVLGSTDLWDSVGLPDLQLANVGSLSSVVLLGVAGLRFGLLGDVTTKLQVLSAIAIAAITVVVYVLIFQWLRSDLALFILGSLTMTIVLVVLIAKIGLSLQVRKDRAAYLTTLGRFSAQMAHDLKNPLAAAKGAMDFLGEERRVGRSLDAQSEYFDLVKDQLSRISEVIDRYQRIGHLDVAVQIVDLNELVRSVASKGDDVELDLSPEPAHARVDRDLVMAAIDNLVANARDAMTKIPGTVGVRVRQASGGVRISVSDAGQGMDTRTKERAFDDFFTTKTTGSGLGLGFVKRVVDRHGGRAWIESDVGRGTCVTLEFPAKKD